MKYIKFFETIWSTIDHYKDPTDKDLPKEGDYVYCTDESSAIVANFIKDKIGQIINIQDINYHIYYENVPSQIIDRQGFHYKNVDNYLTRTFFLSEILYFSPNKEDIQIYIDAMKYNL